MERRLDRRLFLASLGSAGMLAACGGGRNALVPATGLLRSVAVSSMTITFDTTQTDLKTLSPAPLIYAYIVGSVPAGAYWVVDTTGKTQAMSATPDNAYGNTYATFPSSMRNNMTSAQAAAIESTYPAKWANYSIPIPLNATTSISLDGIAALATGGGTNAFSGRIYLSVGAPLIPFVVDSTSKFVQPSVGSGLPGSAALFDWIEFSLDNAYNFNGNTTQVDQFAFPMLLSAAPASGGSTQTVGLNLGRKTVIGDLTALAAPFNGSAYTVNVAPGMGNVYPVTDYLRLMSPKSAIAQTCYIGPLTGYFSQVIADCYTAWQSTPLVVTESSTSKTYSGFVPANGAYAGVLIFYSGSYSGSSGLQTLQTNYNAGQAPAFAITGSMNKIITSSDVFQCANSLATGSTDATNVQKQIAGAFNRGIMSGTFSLNDGSCPASTTFYPPGGTWNAWANELHSLGLNGQAYAFPYDDLCGENPTIAMQTPNVTIQLGNFLS